MPNYLDNLVNGDWSTLTDPTPDDDDGVTPIYTTTTIYRSETYGSVPTVGNSWYPTFGSIQLPSGDTVVYHVTGYGGGGPKLEIKPKRKIKVTLIRKKQDECE